MGSSLKIATFFGIPVFLHWTFGLIFVYVIFLGQYHGWSAAQILETILLFMTLFVCVVLHEFGHALTARRFGVQTRDIILSPIGGIARLNRLPEKPFQEFLVAIAGPAVNLAIALVLSPILLLHSWEQWKNLLFSVVEPDSNFFVAPIGPVGKFFFTLILLNITLAVFNLLPAFPMDGGRVLRSLLSIRLGRVKATQVAAFIGQGLAVLFLLYGLNTGSFITAFIGIFIFLTAGNESRMVRTESILIRHLVSDVMRTQFTRLYVTDTVGAALQRIQNGLEKGFLVFDEWQNIRGSLTEDDLVRAAQQKGTEIELTGLIKPGYLALLETDTLQETFYKIQEKEEKVLPVFKKNELTGLVDIFTLNHFVALQAKLNGKRGTVKGKE